MAVRNAAHERLIQALEGGRKAKVGQIPQYTHR